MEAGWWRECESGDTPALPGCGHRRLGRPPGPSSGGVGATNGHTPHPPSGDVLASHTTAFGSTGKLPVWVDESVWMAPWQVVRLSGFQMRLQGGMALGVLCPCLMVHGGPVPYDCAFGVPHGCYSLCDAFCQPRPAHEVCHIMSQLRILVRCARISEKASTYGYHQHC